VFLISGNSYYCGVNEAVGEAIGFARGVAPKISQVSQICNKKIAKMKDDLFA
jgi:hypothetical protein